MKLSDVFQPFLEKRPVCVMARAALERILDPKALDALFLRTAEQQYTKELLFSQLAELMGQVVLQLQPAVHAAYQGMADAIGVSVQAVYGKLQRVELPVSAALVSYSAARVAAVIRSLGAQLPSWLPGYRIRILDGNHFAATEHRLAELRTTWAAPLPGKCLVVLEQALMLASHVLLAEDGQAQERSLLPEVLPLVERGDLWLGDRNFCTTDFIFGVVDREAFVLLREHAGLPGQVFGQRKAKGRCTTGLVYEQPMRLRNSAGQELQLRRITVELDEPTRDGDTVIHLVTNLPAKKAPAIKLAEVYRKRWTVEGLFLEMAQTLACEIDTLCYPKAALFAFCLGLLASNAVALLKAALRAVHGPKGMESLSAYYLTLEIQQTYDGMMVAIPPQHWQVFGELDAAAMASVLRKMAEKVKLSRYRKHPRGPKKKPPKRRRYQNGEHVATAKILAARKSRK
jgi:hypothetical protein